MSAFCQGFTSLLEIERHTFSALKSLSAFLNRMAVAISFRRCRYVLAHVACRNLPWQGLKDLIRQALQLKELIPFEKIHSKCKLLICSLLSLILSSFFGCACLLMRCKLAKGQVYRKLVMAPKAAVCLLMLPVTRFLHNQLGIHALILSPNFFLYCYF